MSVALSQIFRALRYRNFRLFFVGQGLSVLGTWMQQVAMSWLTYRLSGSVWLLGVVAFCGSAGILFFGTFAGVVADHVRRRRALGVTQSLALLQALALAALDVDGARRRLAPDRRSPCGSASCRRSTFHCARRSGCIWSMTGPICRMRSR